jgi:hypothetical protein
MYPQLLSLTRNCVLQNVFDSVYIVKDTIILTEKFYKIMHTNSGFDYYFNFSNNNYVWLKDSLGYLINYQRRILLDTVNLKDTIEIASFGLGLRKLVPDTFVNRSFCLGTFSGNWMKNCFLYPPNFKQFNGAFCYQAFVKNKGLIKARMLFTNNPYHSMYSFNLKNYHLN